MSLLTPSESHAFQSFLSSIDYDYSIVESLVASADWTSLSDDIGVPVPHPGPAKEALAKATKDLITLPPAPSSSSSSWETTELKDLTFFKPLRLPHNPALGSQPQPPVPQDVPKQRNDFDHLQTIVNNAQTSIHFRPAQSHLHRLPPLASSSSSSATNLAGPSRPLPSSSASHKRQRPSSSRTSESTPSQGAPGSKPALLTASQKKANHIQSEQKRRANIRRGYEALCETIPTLREAIRAEEEASSGFASGGKKRRARGRIGDDGEKVDGRAGPRSENIVLAKTVEYIQQLLAQRQHFTERLQRARAMLPPGHPAHGFTRPPGEVCLWEREWT
ncbi:hypothetical protein B0F90DRAFT_1708244, partial [Multifurca ochricompacta]